jgi:hypothetical protein
MPKVTKPYRTPAQLGAIKKLSGLTLKLGGAREHRVEFLCLAFKHDLVREITHYKLWDQGWEGLGERQWDDCFEMGDAELVIGEVVARAKQEGFLPAIEKYCSAPGAFERWLSLDRQTELF